MPGRLRLHAAGAAILFADDHLLTSDEGAWETWAREAVEAEAYSRRLGRRIAEGYSAKRRRLGIPGGNRPPVGTRREGRPSTLVVDPDGIAVVRRAFDLSAAGLTDRQVAAQLGLKLTHLRELLINPFYRGCCGTGRRRRSEHSSTQPSGTRSRRSGSATDAATGAPSGVGSTRSRVSSCAGPAGGG
jgi:hypothetical protein